VGWKRKWATVSDAREAARRRLPRVVFDFIDGAAGAETAATRNVADLDAVRLAPRVLVDVHEANLAVSFLGERLRAPFGIAPMGMCDLAWPGTDRAFAAEAVRAGVPICVSTATSTPLERMIELAGGNAWFQLYVTGSTEIAESFADRAGRSGYKVLILTVDVPKLGKRPRDIRNGFTTPFRIGGRQFLDFAFHPRWSISTLAAGIPRMANYDSATGAAGYDRTASRVGANWNYVERLRDRWKGKLVVKGVVSPDDAVRLKGLGVDAVYVSNHGGRQLDGAPSTIEALARVRLAVGPGYPLLFDGGVRSGEHIVKAYANGADFVLLGRPYLYASAGAAPAGVSALTDMLKEDITIALAQIGRNEMTGLDASVLWRGRSDAERIG
jgi:L-lactate dehydrogenase (cytochrome)